MISQENIEACKEAIYMHCKSSRICCLCVEEVKHEQHCFHVGTLHIGGLMILRKILNDVLNDTSEQRFRLLEASKYLNSQYYIEAKGMNKFFYGNEIFFATSKLWKEMNKKFENPEEEQKQLWF